MRVALVLLCFGFFCGSAQCQDQPERVLKTSLMPAYPSIATTAHIDGDVRASFVVDANRTVVSVEILSGPPLLRHATEDNIRSWKFAPVSDKSQANVSYFTVFRYRISQRIACDERWVTVTTGSFHAIEITTDSMPVMTSSGSKDGQPPHGETPSHQ